MRFARQVAGTGIARRNLGCRAGDVWSRSLADIEEGSNFTHVLVGWQYRRDLIKVCAEPKKRHRGVAIRSAVCARIRLDATWHGAEDSGHVQTVLHTISRRAILGKWSVQEVIVADNGKVVSVINLKKFIDLLVVVVIDGLRGRCTAFP